MSRYTVEMAPAFEHLRPWAMKIAKEGLPPDAHVIYDKRNKVAWVNMDGFKINIKAFRMPKFPNDFAYSFIRKSKARRSYENALKLIGYGFKTPQPIGYAEVRDKAARLRQSYYFCEQIEGQDIRRAFEYEDSEGLFRALAQEMSKFHALSIFMRDFSGGNVIFQRDDDGSFSLYHIDLNRITFDEQSHKRLMSMFARVMWRREDVARIARMYAECRGLDPAATQAEAVEALARFENKVNFKRKLRGLWKKSQR